MGLDNSETNRQAYKQATFAACMVEVFEVNHLQAYAVSFRKFFES